MESKLVHLSRAISQSPFKSNFSSSFYNSEVHNRITLNRLSLLAMVENGIYKQPLVKPVGIEITTQERPDAKRFEIIRRGWTQHQLLLCVVDQVGPKTTAGHGPMTKNRRKGEQLILLEKPSTCCCLASQGEQFKNDDMYLRKKWAKRDFH